MRRCVKVKPGMRDPQRQLTEKSNQENGKKAHWQIGRPFLGHGDPRFPKILSKSPAHDTATWEKNRTPTRSDGAFAYEESMRGLQEDAPDS